MGTSTDRECVARHPAMIGEFRFTERRCALCKKWFTLSRYAPWQRWCSNACCTKAVRIRKILRESAA
jgi:hypothetical protein